MSKQRYNFQRSTQPPSLQQYEEVSAPSVVEYEQEERVRVSVVDYVLTVGGSAARDFTIGLTCTGGGMAFLHMAIDPSVESALFGGAYLSFTWGISKMFSSNIKLNLVDQFDRNHSINSTSWQREGFQENEGPPQDDPPEEPRTILLIGVQGRDPQRFVIDDLIPDGWSWKMFKAVCRNIKNSGTFSEPGSKVSKTKFAEFRDTFFEYQHNNSIHLVAWRDRGNVRQGLKTSKICNALIAEIAKMKGLKG